MDEQPGVSDQYPMASPWPIFVALGFALSELGLFVGIYSIAVAGLILFGGSIAGILTESGYVTHLWKTATAVGVALAAVGVVLIALQGQFGTGVALDAIETPNLPGYRLLSRGVAFVAGGLILVGTGAAGQLGQRPTS